MVDCEIDPRNMLKVQNHYLGVIRKVRTNHQMEGPLEEEVVVNIFEIKRIGHGGISSEILYEVRHCSKWLATLGALVYCPDIDNKTKGIPRAEIINNKYRVKRDIRREN